MRGIAAIGLAVLSILAAPLARANTTEDNVYINGLETDGVDVNSVGRAALFRAAHDVCAQLDGGNMGLHGLVAKVTGDVPALSATTSALAAVIGGAIGIYCPQYQNQIDRDK